MKCAHKSIKVLDDPFAFFIHCDNEISWVIAVQKPFFMLMPCKKVFLLLVYEMFQIIFVGFNLLLQRLERGDSGLIEIERNG